MYTQPKFAVIAQTVDGYTHDTLFDTLEAALAYANYAWEEMTDRERKGFLSYSIMTGYLDERNCFNTQLAQTIRTYHPQ